ncbi:MAG TPA: phosphosulfolactate synthase [Ilumatobacteraceae bacterium]|nr:phosphosulfolactate synthase [Ilumatobacteraceae bacterium]
MTTTIDDLVGVGRSSKPRNTGLTMVIDTGFGVGFLDDHLATCASHVDLAKLGFGTSMITDRLSDKLDTYRRHQVEPCFGGTLFELFHLHDELDRYAALLREHGITTVEISDGVADMEPEVKLQLIERFAAEFTVLSEVGRKDASVVVAPARWVASIRRELDAGATRVILEGRESGTAGLYRTSGEMRTGLVEEVLDAGFETDRLVFEAPKKDHQTYLIRLLGPNVNLANIAVLDVIACESLRRGLRADTLLDFHPDIRG